VELISKKELKEILIKGWMTHDAMWLLHCLRKTGIETTNKSNSRKSLRSFKKYVRTYSRKTINPRYIE
jgi:hypothetical protein